MSIGEFSVESFVRIKNKFVPLSQCDRKLSDEFYIEGKIELEVEDSKILSEKQWDLVDQLWSYLIDGVSGILFDDRNMECCFPDQPLRLSLKSLSKSQLEVCVGSCVHRVDKTCFIAAIANGGKAFFNKMLQIAPSGKSSWMLYIERIEKLIATIECTGQGT
ncbi:hypothetical protein [Singulisphaera acidiphila]|uniref:Uncharacterized protein n=1 Tax=Singulisphaera acidiphila (strain ATCC BAA-1392 / DSM 18658 / VKM B-2454 / MOB10) TaxID=886293 RepID=L0DHW9_SINAD|nr:hypothetical protein [Singulisphaera acidiphila]AGA28974.1 hypothetical protein Sinac_4812 [Singulisphaera acidiphila DSM 18658]